MVLSWLPWRRRWVRLPRSNISTGRMPWRWLFTDKPPKLKRYCLASIHDGHNLRKIAA